jgi:hypothetical protein
MNSSKYKGPAKPVRTWHRPLIDYIEPIVVTLALVVVLLDMFVWRP